MNNKKKYPTISTYISTENALFYQSTLEQTIRQALLFSDEIIVVNSTGSTDGTQNILNKLREEYPNIIKLYIFNEDYSKKWMTVTEKKTFALKKCTMDYCILQDDDECIHENDIEKIRNLPLQYPDALAFRFKTIHFYRSYNHYQDGSDWYQRKIYMIRNMPEIEHGVVGTDLDNYVIINNKKSKIPLDSLILNKEIINTNITSYHYGWCRNDAILLMKKYYQDELWHGKDYWKTKEFPYKFDNPLNLSEFKGTHPKYMIPMIEQENKFNTRHVNEYHTKEEEKEKVNKYHTKEEKKEKIDNFLTDKYNFSDADGNPEGNIIDNYITVSACILTINEPLLTKNTVDSIYNYVDEIIINDGSDDDSTVKEIKSLINNQNKIKIYHNPGASSNISEERNKMHQWATGDYVLHIDIDEKFDLNFLMNMRNIINQYLTKDTLPLMFKFPRKNVELDIKKNPDYQIRLLNRLYTKWERNVHEIPNVIKNDNYYFHNKKTNIVELLSLDNYIIEHILRDRKNTRKRWDMLSNNSNKFINRRLLICSMFKDSGLWIDDVLSCIDNFMNYNYNLSNDNRLLIKLAFLKSKFCDDRTNDVLDNYIKKSDISIWNKYFDIEYDNLENKLSRYEKLSQLRNYIITESLKEYNLNDDDLILFMDSDVKFDSNIIHELIIDMNKCNADIIAPLICIENYGIFKNNYFYDTLAFKNINDNHFSHFKPYIFGNIENNKISTEKDESVRKKLKILKEFSELRKINFEFNLNKLSNNELSETMHNKVCNILNLNDSVQVNSVGSFYIMKRKVVKNVKYTGNNNSEQIEFMNSARSKGYKIFVSQRLKIFHVNLEKYGLKWH